MTENSLHWADALAQKIIAERGDKPLYILASGITPSGTIHFGKFREVMTVDLVARALARLGKKVRFIYSWDDYDTFRKVPTDMPEQEMLKENLYRPIVDIPDPYGTAPSYARHNELTLEGSAHKVGVGYVEYIYQNELYRAGTYNDNIIITMDARDKVRDILQEFKTNEISPEWQPLETYCTKCNRDRIRFGEYNSADKTVDYECKLCSHKEKLDLRTSKRLKLPWRIDWPMRWAYEKVDFEPGGRDHSSAGGSRDTGAVIARKVFGAEPPVYAVYESIRVKGQTKKMSSSSGNGFSLESVLAVYEPEMVRWFFAKYKNDAMFDMAFDLDVLKNYEEFDRLERDAFAGDEWARRIYELSQLSFDGAMPAVLPWQPSFRTFCNNIQMFDFDRAKTREFYDAEIKTARDERRFTERFDRAEHWLKTYAPEDFKFIVNTSRRTDVELSDAEAAFISELKDLIGQPFGSDKELQDSIATLVEAKGLGPAVYKKVYQLILNRDLGPKLGTLIRALGAARVQELL